MASETDAVQEFLKGLGEKDNSLVPKEKELFTEPLVEEQKEEEEEDVVEDKPLPFHKDPKVQRYVEKQIAKALEGVKPQTEVERFQKETEDEMTDVLVRIIGNDTPEKQAAVKDFRRVLGSLEEKGAERALAQLQEKAQEQQREDVAAQEELDTYFEEIEETYGVDLSSNAPAARKTRSEFVDFVRTIAPKNEEGEVAAFPDLVNAFEVFQASQKPAAPSNSKAKQLASRSLARSSDASSAPQNTDKSWKGVERMFSKLN